MIARPLALLLALALPACAGASAAGERSAPRAMEAPPEPPPPSTPTLALGPLTLRSRASFDTARETRPPLTAELLDERGGVTGTRCGATSFSVDGLLLREGDTVASLHSAPGARAVVLDGRGEPTGLLWTGRAIVSADGEPRFHLEGNTIVSATANADVVEILPAGANVETALALFATLLVCDDLGP